MGPTPARRSAPLPSAALADFNEDGRLDLVQGSLKALRVRPGDGHGGFGRATAKLAWPGMFYMAVGDFDRDHHRDVAAAGFSDDVRVAWGDGTGALLKTPRTKLDAPGEVARLVSADLNRDRRSDLTVVSTGHGGAVTRLTVFLGCRRG